MRKDIHHILCLPDGSVTLCTNTDKCWLASCILYSRDTGLA